MKKDTIRSLTIKHLKGKKLGRVAVEFEMTEEDWAWIMELEDRLMIPTSDTLYCAFFQGLQKQGWKDPEWLTTPDNPPPRTHSLRNNAPDSDKDEERSNVVPLPIQDDLDDDVPF